MAEKKPIIPSLTPYDEIFNKGENIVHISIDELRYFKDHPFKVKDDEEMLNMVDSVKTYGVITPLLARPHKDGKGYEIISGHRRFRASQLAENTKVPVILRKFTDDEAIVAMVDSNMQRENILPSEKAFAYKMKLDALKRQAGRPSKDNSTQVGQNLKGKFSVEILGEQVGESRNQIQRYIRLTELSPELLEMVDNNELKLSPAVEISYLPKDEQAMLKEVMEYEEAIPSLKQAILMKEKSREGKLTQEVMELIVQEERPSETKIVLHGEKIERYFPPEFTPKKMQEVIFGLLENWSKKHGRVEKKPEKEHER